MGTESIQNQVKPHDFNVSLDKQVTAPPKFKLDKPFIDLSTPSGEFKKLADQVSMKSSNTEDMMTEKLAPYIALDQQKKSLIGSPENSHKVELNSVNQDQNYSDIKKNLPYTMSSEGKMQEKPVAMLGGEKSSLPYVESSVYTSDDQLTESLKGEKALFSSGYWERREDYKSLVETTGDITGTVGAIGGGAAGGFVGSFVTPVAGTITGGIAGSVAGEVAGEAVGEDYIAPAIRDFWLNDKELEQAKLTNTMKDVFQARFGDKWENIDIEKTLKAYPSGSHREALYEAYMERPKHRASYSSEQLATLDKTTDKAGNEGRLLAGSDPSKRPNIGLDIGGEIKPIAIAGFYGDMFLNNKFKKTLLKNPGNLSVNDINKATEIMTTLRRSGLAVLPRVEVFLDVNTGDKNLIVYARPNQIKGMLSDKTLGKHVRAEMNKLPLSLKNYNDPEMIKKLDSMKDTINSGFRVSIPFKDSLEESVRNMNVGYFFETNLLKEGGAARNVVNQFGAEVLGAVVVRTIPTNALHKYPKGTTYFLSLVSYASNEADVSKDREKNKDTDTGLSSDGSKKRGRAAFKNIVEGAKAVKSVGSAVGKTVGTAIAKLSPDGGYLAAGATVNIASIDPTGKVIDEETGQEVYTSNVNFGLNPDFISTSKDKKPNDYYMLPAFLTDVLDIVNPEGK